MARRKKKLEPWEVTAGKWILGQTPPIEMAPGASPVEMVVETTDDEPDPALVRAASAEKWDDCHHYAGCLDHAASLDWHQFSCRSCPVFQQAVPGETYEISLRREDPSEHLYSIGRPKRGVGDE